MTAEIDPVAGWIINGFQYVSLIWIWTALVALHGLWRSMAQPEPDAIRPSGPSGL
jgi:hypothetical protein